MDIHGKDELSDKILATTMMELIATAASDGKVTDEEKSLLDQLDPFLLSFKFALEQALEDGVVTKQEALKLQQLKDTIVTQTFVFAHGDLNLSRDELRILMTIMKSLEVPKPT